MEALLKSEARIDVRDKEGRTALATAVANRRPKTVNLLIQSGANVHIQDRKGSTPRDLARKNGDKVILEMLEIGVANYRPGQRTPKPNPDEGEPEDPGRNVSQQRPRPGEDSDLEGEPAVPKGKTGLLRQCEEMFRGVKEETAKSREAKAAFAKMTEETLRRDLVPLRKSQKNGSFPYRSVAYVLAYHKVDVVQNARRVMYLWLYPGSGSRTESDDELTPEAVRRLYVRHPSEEFLGFVLLAQQQSKNVTDQPAMLVADMFMQYPNSMLRAAASRLNQPPYNFDGIGTLAQALDGFAGRKRVRTALDRLRQSREKGVATAAADLQKELARLRQD